MKVKNFLVANFLAQFVSNAVYLQMRINQDEVNFLRYKLSFKLDNCSALSPNIVT